MNLNRLYQILADCTVQLRKGEVVERHTVGSVEVVEVNAMPHESEAQSGLEKIDMELLTIGVDRMKAESHKAELISILKEYPQPERLKGGPSYIEVGGEIGDQGAAFQLFAAGKVLELWDVITPSKLGITGPQAREMAGGGFVMMSGYDIAA